MSADSQQNETTSATSCQMSSAAAVTSFQRRGRVRPPSVQGTRPSSHNLQLLASSGVASMDAMLGGGLPVGSVVLLVNENEGEEEGQVDYTRLLHKYFLAEGAAEGNGVFHASCGHLGSDGFLAALPDFEDAADCAQASCTKANCAQADCAKVADDNLQIAWRYKQQGSVAPSSREGQRRFNLNKTLDRGRLDRIEHHEWTPPVSELDEESDCDHYRRLFGRLKEVLSQPKYSSNPQVKDKNLMRISVQDADSLLWGADRIGLTRFLLALRSLLRTNIGICMLNLNLSSLSAEEMADVAECCDFVIGLKAFDAKIRSGGLFKHHHGFLSFKKYSGFNCLQPPATPPSRCVFKSSRTRLVVEQIHLPPDLAEDPKPSTKREIDF